jgi:large subunit ribosomal protein L9
LNFTARAGESGRLYGSITTAQITDQMNEVLGTEIDRRKVGDEALRQLGTHQVLVRLSGDYQPQVTVIIKPEAGEPEAEAVVEAAEPEMVEEEAEEENE